MSLTIGKFLPQNRFFRCHSMTCSLSCLHIHKCLHMQAYLHGKTHDTNRQLEDEHCPHQAIERDSVSQLVST
jgi:hypothetical protein